MRCSGARIAQSSQPHATVSPAAVDLVVLSDYLVAEHACCATCTAGASPTLRFECETAPVWWVRWSFPGVTSWLVNH